MNMKFAVLLCLGVGALTSCAPADNPAENPTEVRSEQSAAEDAIQPGQPVPPKDDVAVPVAAATVGGDGSQIVLKGLTSAQLDGVDLPGELACSFADTDGATLLLARADVLPDGAIRGAVNHNGYVEMLGNGRAGGFNDLADGVTMSGKGLTLVLERGEQLPTGDEATQHAASLKVQRGDGAERTYPGVLTCGP